MPRLRRILTAKTWLKCRFGENRGSWQSPPPLSSACSRQNYFFAPDQEAPTHANLIGDPDDELIIWGNPPKIDPSPFALRNQVLVSQENDGIVEVEPGRPMWKIRIKVLDRNDSRKDVVPVERVLYVPVRHD